MNRRLWLFSCRPQRQTTTLGVGRFGCSQFFFARWNTEIRKATKLPDLKARLVSEGFDIDDSPPEVFQAVLKRDVDKWKKVVREAKVKVE